jgi:hypothetical protein
VSHALTVSVSCVAIAGVTEPMSLDEYAENVPDLSLLDE